MITQTERGSSSFSQDCFSSNENCMQPQPGSKRKAPSSSSIYSRLPRGRPLTIDEVDSAFLQCMKKQRLDKAKKAQSSHKNDLQTNGSSSNTKKTESTSSRSVSSTSSSSSFSPLSLSRRSINNHLISTAATTILPSASSDSSSSSSTVVFPAPMPLSSSSSSMQAPSYSSSSSSAELTVQNRSPSLRDVYIANIRKIRNRLGRMVNIPSNDTQSERIRLRLKTANFLAPSLFQGTTLTYTTLETINESSDDKYSQNVYLSSEWDEEGILIPNVGSNLLIFVKGYLNSNVSKVGCTFLSSKDISSFQNLMDRFIVRPQRLSIFILGGYGEDAAEIEAKVRVLISLFRSNFNLSLEITRIEDPYEIDQEHSERFPEAFALLSLTYSAAMSNEGHLITTRSSNQIYNKEVVEALNKLIKIRSQDNIDTLVEKCREDREFKYSLLFNLHHIFTKNGQKILQLNPYTRRFLRNVNSFLIALSAP